MIAIADRWAADMDVPSFLMWGINVGSWYCHLRWRGTFSSAGDGVRPGLHQTDWTTALRDPYATPTVSRVSVHVESTAAATG